MNGRNPIPGLVALVVLLFVAAPATAADGADEAYLVRESDAAEHALAEKGYVVADPALRAYVERVGRRIVERLPAPAFRYRFHVVRDPAPDAFSLANGAIFVHQGLLAATGNEAELAYVLAHEIVHGERRHHLAGYRDSRQKTLTAKITDMLSGGLATPLVLPSLASGAAGFSREQENEADREGLHLVWSAGYRAESAVGLFRAIEETLPPPAPTVERAYLSHPGLGERAAAARALLPGFDPPATRGEVGESAHASATRAAVRSTIELALQQRFYRHAGREIERQRTRGHDPAWISYARGELHRLVSADPDGAAFDEARETGAASPDPLLPQYRSSIAREREAAREAYGRALELDPGLAVAHRGLGLLAHATGDAATASRELDAYLASGSFLPDRRTIERILREVNP